MAELEYVLGHTQSELDRLQFQAAFYERQTRLLFAEVPLVAGQRILDFGCGVGDVSFLAAQFVGPQGKVVGVDRAEAAVQTARSRAHQLGLSQVEFLCADEAKLAELLAPGSFDVVVGRLVLMYQPDPTACLRRLATFLRPGGQAVFQEAQMGPGWHGGLPVSPLFGQVWTWVTGLCVRAGVELDMGLRLRRALLDTGFTEPSLLLTGRVEGGDDSPAYKYLAETIRSMLPALVKFGLATEAEVEIDTLADRLQAEYKASGGVLVPTMLIGAHARRISS